MKNMQSFIVRSAINPALVLCTNGEFMADGFFGPGHKLQAKIYKHRAAARKVRGGYKIIVEYYESEKIARSRCPDCGERGALKGHIGCQYPEN